jgi:cysteine-rich repeat protein
MLLPSLKTAPLLHSRSLGLLATLTALTSLTACSVDTDVIFGEGGGGTGGDASGPTTSSTGGGTTTSSSGGGGGGPGCGNGVLDTNEACDGANLNDRTCVDFGFSAPGGLACASDCSLDPSGCASTCDGALLEPGEECEGNDLGGATCQDFGFASPGGLACTGCALDPSGCAIECGNGVAEPGEACDGADLDGADCTDFGFVGATGATCAANCSAVVTSGCAAACNGTLEPGETCDGANLNGHDCTDLGYANAAGMVCTGCSLNAAGCKAVCGNNMVEPGEQCDDGGVMPGDGCSATCQTESPTGLTCQTAIPVSLGNGTTTRTGTTVGGGAHAGAGCSGDAGADVIYAVTVTASGFLTASLKRGPTDFDSVLYVSNACSDMSAVNDLLCADSYDPTNNQPLDGGEVVSLRVQQGQTVYVFVDGFAMADAGNYQLTLDLSDGRTCTDPVPIPLESGAAMTVRGSNNNTFLTTQGSCGGAPGGHVVYAIARSTDGPLTVDTDPSYTNYNSVLYSRSTCTNGGTEIDCSNQNANAMESIGPSNLTTGTPIFVYVDGSQAGGGNAFGNYGLTLTP